MANVEQESSRKPEQSHVDPAVVEWSLPQEGVEIRLQINHPGMEELSPAAREKLTLIVQRVALLCEFIVAEHEAITRGSLSVEGSLSFAAEQLKDLTSFFQEMAKRGDADEDESDFPF